MMNNKTWLGIPALTAIILTGLLAVVFSQALALSQIITKPLLLTDQHEQYPLGLYMDILSDPSGELTIAEVSSPTFDTRFIPSQTESPNYGFKEGAYWVRLVLDNETLQTAEWLLEVNFANMHYVDLYTPLSDGRGFDVRQSGVFRPVSTRDVIHPQIVFDLLIPTHSQQTIYLRFQSGGSMTLALTLWTNHAFLADSQRQLLVEGLFFGILFGLLVYNLFLLFSLRDVNYLNLVFQLVATIFFVASYDGYMAIFTPANLHHLTQYFTQLSFTLFLLSIVLFADAFLDIKAQIPKLHRVNIVLLAVWGVLVLIVPFVSYHALASLVLPWAMVSLISVMAAGIISIRRGFRPARLFLVAWAGLLVTLFITILVRLGLISVTSIVENLFRLGMVWLGVCWSIALADRINLLKDETENANRGLQKSERRLSAILEGMPIGVVLYGKDHKPKYVNQRTVDILSNPEQGIRPDISAGRTIAQAIQYYSFKMAGSGEEYPLENFPPYSAIHGVAASVDNLEMELGNKRVALELWASPITDDAGNVESAIVAFQDITQRKQVEDELAEYRKHLESLAAERTVELDASNKELRLRLEWMSAIVLITETMARSSDFGQIHERIIKIINQLFAIQDSFIAELDESHNQLKILAHSCRSENHLNITGSFTTLPVEILADSSHERGKITSILGGQLSLMSGPLGSHIQTAKIHSIVLVPLLLHEKVFGVLGLEMLEEGRIITSEETNLLKIFSVDIAHLIEDSHLFEQSKALISAEERNRLARDLHDSVTQTLFTASVLAEATPRIWDKDQRIARQNLDKLSLLIRGALAEMRSMLIELRSGDLQNQTLDQLLATLVAAARARTNTIVVLSILSVAELPNDVTLTLYRIAREAINNALVHASATEVNVSLSAREDHVELHVQDDGCGFDLHTVPTGHLGLRIMSERMAEIGGDVQIQSKLGHGTDIALIWSSNAGEFRKHA
jgi:two-component system nitrate/nitrite sensor histidine kinase NarX